MYANIEKHGEMLNAIFDTGIEPVKLCKALRRLETKAHKLATDYCNGENGVNTDNWEQLTDPIVAKVNKILRIDPKRSPVFVNGDARGYALKLQDEWAKDRNIYKDWGGYGILAPDFRVN
jgi:hypothetical protein